MILELPTGRTVGAAALKGERWAWDMLHGAFLAGDRMRVEAAVIAAWRGDYRLHNDADLIQTWTVRALGHIEGKVRIMAALAAVHA